MLIDLFVVVVVVVVVVQEYNVLSFMMDLFTSSSEFISKKPFFFSFQNSKISLVMDEGQWHK